MNESIKKESAPAVSGTDNESLQDDTITKSDKLSTMDSKKGRHFWFVVYPSEKWIREHDPQCEYDGSDGWGTAPDNWIQQMIGAGLMFCVSPLHDKDRNPDGKVKKPHWHVIVSWNNTTTYRAARGLCDGLKCPPPQLLKSVKGAYRYAQHKDNPEKYQYMDPPAAYNGWSQPLEKDDINRLMEEITYLMYDEDCEEYTELVTECIRKGPEYFEVVRGHTFYFAKMCDGFRNRPVRSIARHLTLFKDGDERKAKLEQLLSYYKKGSDGKDKK